MKKQHGFEGVLFLKRIIYNKTDGAYGTAVLSPIFELNRRLTDGESDVVAGPGIEPGSGGYAYHYSFRYSAPKCVIWGLDYTFIFLLNAKSDAYHLVSTPSVAYAAAWLGIAMLIFATSEGFTEFGKNSIACFYTMSPLEPPEVPLLYPAIYPSVGWDDYTTNSVSMQLIFVYLGRRCGCGILLPICNALSWQQGRVPDFDH